MIDFQVNTRPIINLADDAESALKQVSVGDSVSLCGDKFIVKISKVANGSFSGVVTSSVDESQLKSGTFVEFQRNHIFGVFKGI